MKKLLILFIALLAALSAPAQLRIPRPIWGVKTGMNISYLDNNQTYSDSRIGVYAGGFAEWAIGAFAISPELLWSREGASSPDFTPVGNNVFVAAGDRVRIGLDYLKIPLTAKWYVGRVSFDFGLQYSYLLHTSVTVEGNRTNAQEPTFKRGDFNTSAFSTFVGTGIVYEHLGLNIRAIYGQTPVFRNLDGRQVTIQMGGAWAF